MTRIDRFPGALRAATLLLAGTLAACSDAPTGAAPESTDTTLARQVAALGFRADMIQDHGDFVLVEGDIYLSKAQLRTVPRVPGGDPMSPKFQYRSTNLVGSPKVHQITVDLSGLNSQTAWKSAAQTAIAHWNGISSSYVKLTEGTPADITVSTDCVSSSVAAYASFPSGGNPGSTIFVNTCFGYTTSSAQKVHNMVHEFGHTLGFRHSNWNQVDCDSYGGDPATCNWNPGTIGAVHIGGTPTSGNAGGSAMNGGTALNSWAGFAASDLTAVRSLYPLPYPVLGISHPFGNVVVSWAPLVGAYSYQIRYMRRYTTYNGYESTHWENLIPGSWEDVYGTSYESGYPWAGESYCYYQNGYDESTSESWYEVRALFANGVGQTGYIGAEDLAC